MTITLFLVHFLTVLGVFVLILKSKGGCRKHLTYLTGFLKIATAPAITGLQPNRKT